MEHIFRQWEKENSKEELINQVSEKVRLLYMNSQLSEIEQIFNSKFEQYIDLEFKEGSIVEFCALMKDYKKTGQPIEELKKLVSLIEQQSLNKDIFKKPIHNILLTAVSFNNINMIVYITKEQKICEVDFSYAECAIINNCFPKNNNSTKKDILNYFIIECDLRKTPEIEKILKEKKRKDIIEVLDKVDTYQKMNQKYPDKDNKVKRSKI